MSLSGSNDSEKLADLSKKNYKAQAIWFLNSFWNDFASKEAENIYQWKAIFDKLDLQNHADGCELDELNIHRFLEQLNSTMTVRELRDYIRSIGVEKVKYVPMCHYLIARFKADLHKLVTASQGDNQEEVDKAQKMLEEVQALFKSAEARQKEATAAEIELKAALAELKKQEDEFNGKTDELTKKTESGGVVAQNRAKAELASHLASDPLPLRRAKINTEAATKKAEKAKLAADEAFEAAKKKVDEAEAYLKEVSSRSGSAKGAIFWIDRDLQEAKKYLPTRKGGVAK
jgi:vacuolar-type H+-ATPase subunit I/STV1